MDRKESYFFPRHETVASRRTFVVHGMGGVGKTQLCVAFARRNQTRYKQIFWLDGSSKESLLQSLAQSASRALGLVTRRVYSIWKPAQPANSEVSAETRQIVEQMLTWLASSQNQNWLIILDNFDRDWRNGTDPQAFNYRDFLPESDHGSVLITSRLADLQIPLTCLHLKNFDDAQSLELLEARAGKPLPGEPVPNRILRPCTTKVQQMHKH